MAIISINSLFISLFSVVVVVDVENLYRGYFYSVLITSYALSLSLALFPMCGCGCITIDVSYFIAIY